MKKEYTLEEVKQLVALHNKIEVEDVSLILDEHTGEALGYSADCGDDFSI